MKHRTGMLLKRGRGYYCRWTVNGKQFERALRDENGQTITTIEQAETARTKLMASFRVAEEAEALQSVAAQLEGKRAEIAKLDEARHPPLAMSAAWHEYVASPDRPDSGEATLEQYESEFRRFARWLAKEHADIAALRDVTPDLAAAYAKDLNGAGYRPGSFNQHIGFLRLLWSTLAVQIRGHGNPWERIKSKTLIQQSRRELTIDELRSICEKAKGELRTLLALGIYTGLRLGDCATLRWGEVDLVRGIVIRVPMKTARRKGNPVTVPIHPTLRAILAETPEQARRDTVLPQIAAAYRRDSSAVTKLVSKHLNDCGITLHKAGTGFETITGGDGKFTKKHTGKRAVVEAGFHSLRHSFVSLCRAAGAPLSVVESIVGHSNPAMTRHYTHTGEAAALAAVTLLPAVIGEPPKALPPPTHMVDAEAVRKLAEGMTSKTWRNQRAELLALVMGHFSSGK